MTRTPTFEELFRDCQRTAVHLEMRDAYSGVGASAVAADKILCKRVMLTLGVPTPGWQVWSGAVPAIWNGRP